MAQCTIAILAPESVTGGETRVMTSHRVHMHESGGDGLFGKPKIEMSWLGYETRRDGHDRAGAGGALRYSGKGPRFSNRRLTVEEETDKVS